MSTANQTSFFDLDSSDRFKVYAILASLGCETYKAATVSGLSVAVARGKYGELTHELAKIGFAFRHLYTFPLGTDTPPEHLRHDSAGVPGSVWLIANFAKEVVK